ncbi:hypothetical protein [Pseudomonas sp. 18175]|uniref:hypothetical protein n=1 Tax=Pseudomonas sp. 18175 TaxID=3390056 RepID=UPI003D1939BB
MTVSDASLRQLHMGEIHALFSPPPTLNEVAANSAQAYLDLHFAGRNYVASHVYVVAPSGPYRSLVDWVLQRLAAARPTLLVEAYHRVLQRVREDYVAAGPSLAEAEALINQCGAGLLGAYSRRLQVWWREALPVEVTRWGGLSDELLALFYDASPPPGMARERFDAMFPKAHLRARRPDRLWSAQSPALQVQTVHLRQPPQMLPLLLFSQPAQAGFLLFSPASGVQWLDNLDALQALLPAYTRRSGPWFTVDVQGDPFDALAASFLQRQLQDINRLNPQLPRPVEDYLAQLRQITDTHRWFVRPLSDRQQALHDQLPLWLLQADPDASIAYAQLLRALVLDRQQHGTADYLDGIPTLKGYASEQLHLCLRKDPKTAHLKPDDIILSFDRVIAVAVPVPGGFVAGEVEHIELNLTQLALENLAGFPYTAKTIRPAGLNYEALKACVTSVDVGQTYLDLLKKHLLDEPVESARRSRRFGEQLRIQLPMQALEWQIKGLHGLTREGIRRLRAALQATAAQRQGLALWPLAFKVTATSLADTVDTVANMYVIGPQQGASGCHLLYRPSFEASLLEFVSLEALFEAIKQPGTLHDSVLSAIKPQRQGVYDHDGFREPHVWRFAPGDEFTQYTRPPPVQLSKTVAGDDLTRLLFVDAVQAVMDIADRESVSNTENNWADVKRAAWLIFGLIQPLLSGPAKLVGWLVQLIASAQQDIAGLQSSDPQARSAAVMDVLVNLMSILAHQATPDDVQQHLDLEHAVFAPKNDLPRVPLTRVSAPAKFIAPAAWANARDVLTPPVQARLNTLSLKTFPLPWPKALPGAQPRGPWRGLLRVQQQWQALVRGQLFRVRIEQGRVRVISADGSILGPWLKAVGGGSWDLDLQLRLSGGADEARAAPVDRHLLETQYQQATVEGTRLQRALEIARNLLQHAQGQADEQRRTQAQARYRQALEDKARQSIGELGLLRRLRELGPRPRYEAELSQLLESIVLTLQLLDTRLRAQVQQANAEAISLLERSETGGGEQDHAALNQGMRRVAASYDSAIDWRSQEDRYLNELREVPRFGRDKSAALLAQTPARPSLLDLQSLQLTALWGLAIDVPGQSFEGNLLERMSATVVRAGWASRSLAERAQVQASNAEQIALLESIDHIFAQTDDQIEFWRAMEPEKFDLESLDRFQQLLTALHQQVERDLTALLGPAAPEVPAPKPAPAQRKKIIRMRNRDLLVARTEPQSSNAAQLADANGRVIGTFTEADDGVWEQTPSTPAPRPDPELGSLLKTARTLLQQVDSAIANVEQLAGRANDLASLQDLLEAEARRRLWLANKIRERLNSEANIRLAAVQQANARTAEAELRKAVTRLNEAGLAMRIRATCNNVLTQDGLVFLQQHQQVHIVREGARVMLKGPPVDYLQVYRVEAVQPAKVLAYAHFHYARAQDLDDHFSAGHLKTPEQNRLGRKAQARAEATGGKPLEIHRSAIGLALARRIFFNVD